ncbi:MAG TPA: TonB-dependent receptor [Longimicrobium sp.]|nr:TonB-dependent receptor [Longimicrobium sp.]
MKTAAAFALTLLLLATPPAAAQPGPTDVLTGRVAGPDRAPLSGARVTATSLQTQQARTAITDASGRYVIAFPGGGGRYRVRASFLGMADRVVTVERGDGGATLTADLVLDVAPLALDGIEVRATRPGPGRGEAGSSGRGASRELMQLLPLEDADPATLARLAPGVVTLGGGDTLAAFSIAGQRTALNATTVDGASFGSALTGASSTGVPAEGLRSMAVLTNTWDVARGQFTGGQVSLSTRAGTNQVQGSLSPVFRRTAPGLGAAAPWSSGVSLLRLSGGVGGPLVRDRLFYFASAQAQRRDDAPAAFLFGGRAADRLGVHPDSAARFLDIVSRVYGAPLEGQVGRFARTQQSGSALLRLDWALHDRHNLALRLFGAASGQDHARIGPLELRENGGESRTRNALAGLTLTSRLGDTWVGEMRASYAADERRLDGYAALPEARVEVLSHGDDGAPRVSSFAFGGDRFFPSRTRERTAEWAGELSRLAGGSHRIKLGAQLLHSRFAQEGEPDALGTFTFRSLADLEARRPAAFTRALDGRDTEGGALSAALYAGDSWRPSARLQLTLGLRAEATRLDGAPAPNPRVSELFGEKTDRFPAEVHVSPRLGFSWRLARTGPGASRVVRGGVGEFRGRAPLALYAAALEQTGLTASDRRLVCVGEAAPVPDWGAYRAAAGAIPTACRDGATGAAPLPTVSLFHPRFGAPRSWRASLGFETPVWGPLNGSVDVGWSRGVGLYGVRDLNLDTRRAVPLPREGGRPFFADPAAVPPSGEVAPATSRVHPDFGGVYQVHSGLGSETVQATFSLNGVAPPRIFFQLAYTLSRTRDQSSFSCCSPAQGFASAATGGDPNRPEWAPGDLDRRHVLTAVAAFPVLSSLDLTLVGRAMSGAPYTPLAAGDVNGDGVRNDRAFVFDPAGDDPAGAGIGELLARAPGRARECLRAQLGRVAARNSCRGPWYASVDLRASFKPRDSTWSRVTLSVDVTNLPAGIDRLLHGAEGARGWGQYPVTDPVLLYARGWDAAERAFRYEVNRDFGRPLNSRYGFGAPMQVQLSARVAVGAPPSSFAAFSSLAFGGLGGDGERRGGGGPPDFAAILDRVFDNPVQLLADMRDSLGLSAEQAAALKARADTLESRLAVLRTDGLARLKAAGEDMTAWMTVMGPVIRDGRLAIQAAVEDARTLLTPAQWARVPAVVKEALSGGPYRMRQ